MKYTKEEKEEVERMFLEVEINAKKNVPFPTKRDYITKLLNKGYTPTVCLETKKIPIIIDWQNTFFVDQKEEFLAIMLEHHYEFNFGVMTGLAKFNNVSVFDFDIKRLNDTDQNYIIELIETLLKNEYISNLISDNKIFVETSISNGYHFVVSVNDVTERQGKKLLDYTSNNAVNEVIETRGHKQHFVTYPSLGYSKISNNIYDLVKIETVEYEEIEKYILDYFLQQDCKFSIAGTHKIEPKQKKIFVKKSDRQITNVASVVVEELKTLQSVFAKSNKDIDIIQKLLLQNGYRLVNENSDYIYYLHPTSRNSDPNLAISKNNHCITNFSNNNNQFSTNKSTGTLTAFYILNGSVNSVTEIVEILRNTYNVKLIRTPQEIMNEFRNMNRGK
jgi:hypothetical protein